MSGLCVQQRSISAHSGAGHTAADGRGGLLPESTSPPPYSTAGLRPAVAVASISVRARHCTRLRTAPAESPALSPLWETKYALVPHQAPFAAGYASHCRRMLEVCARFHITCRRRLPVQRRTPPHTAANGQGQATLDLRSAAARAQLRIECAQAGKQCLKMPAGMRIDSPADSEAQVSEKDTQGGFRFSPMSMTLKRNRNMRTAGTTFRTGEGGM